MKTATICAAALAATASPCAAVTGITFTNVPGAVGAAVSSYTENGYTFAAASGSLSAQRIGTDATLGTTSNATVNLTYGGGAFQLLTLGAIAQSSGTGSISYIGYLNGTTVLTGGFAVAAAAGALYVAVPLKTVDRIALTLDRGTAANLALSFSTVAPATVTALPEPATWGMMLLGFVGLGYAMRRGAKVATRVRFA